MTEDRALTPDDFGDFYLEIRKRKPYRWQRRAARELTEGAIWPALSAPTGTGKTTLIECFLFALACVAQKRPRPLPLRLTWVIDRRGVADDVFDHARSAAEAIHKGSGEITSIVRAQLRALSADHLPADEPPVQVRLWRGGLAGAMASEGPRTPLVPVAPAVVCSTVDQIGSRLLFRGYGVSHRSRPMEAALVGNDNLVVLDEAHLSGPFCSTARAVVDARVQSEVATGPLRVTEVSATHAGEREGAFRLTQEERSEPEIAKRLAARKWASLIPGTNQVRKLASEATRLARDGAQIVGVVTNTVATARATLDALGPDVTGLLFIGPCRPLERASLLERIPGREKRRGDLDKPLFVVGTQTLEVGLDLDFDALVTACAPLSSLVQRFGRLDRAGDLQQTKAAIIAPPKACHVYGEITNLTWDWLNEVSGGADLDFGPEGAEQLLAKDPPQLEDQPTAPILAPWHVDYLMQTSHDPVPSPDVGVFLHGERALELADVQIAWRADLRPPPDDSLDSEAWADAEWAPRLRLRLPHAGELVSLPLPAVRHWLAREPQIEIADIESLGEAKGVDSQGRVALRVPPRDPGGAVHPEPVYASKLAPGDVIVVPALYGGCDEFGWAPTSVEPVTDLGNLSTQRPRILIAAELKAPEPLLAACTDALDLLDRDELSEADAFEQVVEETRRWLEEGAGYPTDSEANRTAAKLGGALGKRGRALASPSAPAPGGGRGLLLIPQRSKRNRPTGQVLYKAHVEAVELRATSFAGLLALPPEIVETVRFAARYHDAGKLDPRFQVWLNDGSAADPDRLLAKSGRSGNDPRSEAARRAAGWPHRKLHEAISATLAARVDDWPVGVDRDLLLHLIASHHGDGRPFRLSVPDPESVEVRAVVEGRSIAIASDEDIPWNEHVHRFVSLTDRFGAWGLAALESILVLADRSVSAEEAS